MRVFILAIIITLCACSTSNPLTWISPHKMEIQQGNYVTEDAVAKLKPGMSRSQVRFLLGSPLLIDPFHANRWDYTYSDIQQGKLNKTSSRLLTIYFKNDQLDRVEGHAQAAE